METMDAIYTLIERAENAVHEQRFELAQAPAPTPTSAPTGVTASPPPTAAATPPPQPTATTATARPTATLPPHPPPVVNGRCTPAWGERS